MEESGIGASTRKSEGDRKRKRLQEKKEMEKTGGNCRRRKMIIVDKMET